MEYVLPIIVASLQGFFSCLTIFNAQDFYKRITFLGGNLFGTGGILFSFIYFSQHLGIPKEAFLNLTVIYCVSLLLFFLLSIFALNYFLKTRKSLIKIDIFDLLLGQENLIKQYWESRRLEIEKDLRNQQIENKQESINQKEKEVKILTERLEKIKIEFEDASKKYPLKIELPINNPIPIDESFIGLIPSFTKRLVRFCHYTEEVLRDFKNEYDNGERSDLDVAKGFIVSLCYAVCHALCGADDVRAHFRILKDGSYHTLTANAGGNLQKKPLTPMPSDKGMIYMAGTIKRSLIKKLNEEYHSPGAHDTQWENYITLVFDNYFDGSKPQISMGISVQSDHRHKELLKFLNYIQIEQIIQRKLDRLSEIVNLTGCLVQLGNELQRDH